MPCWPCPCADLRVCGVRPRLTMQSNSPTECRSGPQWPKRTFSALMHLDTADSRDRHRRRPTGFGGTPRHGGELTGRLLQRVHRARLTDDGRPIRLTVTQGRGGGWGLPPGSQPRQDMRGAALSRGRSKNFGPSFEKFAGGAELGSPEGFALALSTR